MSERTPAEVFAPGEFIAEELTEQGWTHARLASAMNQSAATVSDLVNARIPLTLELASRLAAAFDTSAEVWLRLGASYRTHPGSLRTVPA